ncbi:MAG: 4-alpha-glucanotransferase [Pseudobacter sp.]|uniref:4-alpha-glucanotransferase n=1 Tax=Pseudobacter sp. TaxID=2045420 RepID=UPI003F80A155
MKIHFYIRFHTRFGQQLAVTGNAEALGNDTIAQAFRLEYLNEEFWHGSIELPIQKNGSLHYKYVLLNDDGHHVMEWGEDRLLEAGSHPPQEVQLIDTWNHAGEFENAFYTAPFQDVLLAGNKSKKKAKWPKHFTHVLKVKAPLLKKNEVICVTGSSISTREWDTTSPLLLSPDKGWWTIKLEITKDEFPLHYKYGVYNTKEESLVQLETGENRSLFGDAHEYQLTQVHDGFVHLPNNSWKGAGVSVPVFSLRSKNSFGTGEFTDLKLLADWASKTGLRLIQILPVNDTIATHTWIDTYPYAAISAFALHPLYLNLSVVAGKKYADVIKPLKKKQQELNALPDLSYEEVMKFKLGAIRELFALQKEEFLKDENYQQFFKDNEHWLVPYAAFSYLRDKNRTVDFNQWKTYSTYDKAAITKLVAPSARHFNQVAIHYFTQYHLHLQLKDAAEYAHKQGVILKGDIPIGVYRYGCDAWTEPELYHMEQQAGAPPDDFAVKGQNWGFPTYNWERMAEDGFEWWHRRFVQMGNYFDAFRIDHILGFFRIWSIPLHAVEGIMGTFSPALPVMVDELHGRHISYDHNRYCTPYINDAVLWEMFGPNHEKLRPFLQPTGNGHYALLPEYATQQQVQQYFSKLEASEDNLHIKQGLYDLISNVIFFEQPGSNQQGLHFRIAMDQTSSFRHLDDYTRGQLQALYWDYFYHRQDNTWMDEAMKKLPALKRSTNMLICGEDLGMVPHCVPDAMKQLGILSLEIQRMPKEAAQEFLRLPAVPYLSVVTPSTHDMSTIRGWWEEDRESTQHFFQKELEQWGEAPYFCEPWINKAIVMQHLHAPAMWAIFQLQDLLGMDETLRRERPEEERINIPAITGHYWKYRMHFTLEQLIREQTFNEALEQAVKASGRA